MPRADYSLVVISRNRPQFLLRLFQYYQSQRFAEKILVGDASSGSNRDEVSDAIKVFQRSLDLAFTPYPEAVPPLERLALEMGKVRSRYVAWVGDDDFLIPRGLHSASAYLDRHEDCTAVIGRALQFMVDADRARGRVATVGEYQQIPCEQTRASERLLAEAHHGTAYTYALRRTEIIKEILARFELGFWPDDAVGYYFFEMMDGLLTAISGRVVALERLMLLRQTHADSTAARGRQQHKLYRIVLHPRWPEFSRKVIEVLAGELRVRQPELDTAQRSRCAELALCMRIDTTLQKGTTIERNGFLIRHAGPMHAAKDFLRRLLPGAARRKSFFLQRLKLQQGDYRELSHVVRVIESRHG